MSPDGLNEFNERAAVEFSRLAQKQRGLVSVEEGVFNQTSKLLVFLVVGFGIKTEAAPSFYDYLQKLFSVLGSSDVIAQLRIIRI